MADSISAGRMFGTGLVGITSRLFFLDAHFDAVADAYLLGQIDYDIVGSGTVNLTLAAGESEPAFLYLDRADNTIIPLEPNFGNATLVVVPEPGGTTLLWEHLDGWSVGVELNAFWTDS